MWDDFAYPSQKRPQGVFERGLSASFRELVASHAEGVERTLKTEDRDLLLDCLFAATNWASVLTSAGAVVRMVGGPGQHVVTVPATPPERQSGYRTDDDGLVQHWWLMVEPDGSVFDPTAHQFDERGGVTAERYQVDEGPMLEWRQHWATVATNFPLVTVTSNDTVRRMRLRLRGGP